VQRGTSTEHSKLRLKHGRHPIQKLEVKNAFRQLFISSTHFATFTLFSDTEAWRWVLIYFFMTDSGSKNVWACVNYDTPNVVVFLNLRVLNPASKSVTIDFGNGRHGEPGNVVCPWWRLGGGGGGGRQNQQKKCKKKISN